MSYTHYGIWNSYPSLIYADIFVVKFFFRFDLKMVLAIAIFWWPLIFSALFLDRYVLKLEKADVYRLPYLASSGPGFGLSLTPFFFQYFVPAFVHLNLYTVASIPNFYNNVGWSPLDFIKRIYAFV